MSDARAERLKAFIQEHATGSCRILSKDDCQCPLCDVDALLAKPPSDVRLRLRWGVEVRDGRIVSAHQEREWAEKELKYWALFGPMVIDLDAKARKAECRVFSVGHVTNKCSECGMSRVWHDVVARDVEKRS